MIETIIQRRWIRWLLIFMGWNLIGLFFSTQIYLIFNVGEGRPLSFSRAMSSTVPDWYIWAVFALIIVRISRRFRFDRENWVTSLFFHLLASFFFAAMHVIIANTLLYVFGWGWGESRPWAAKLQANFFWYFYWNVLTYWAIVGFSHAASYYVSLEERRLKVVSLEAQLVHAQLQALKMQLHPHFLFNTLNSISVLINKDVHLAKKMISRLADFLRMTLQNSGSDEVLLLQEIEFLKCYLEIERVRFQDRLTVRIEIDPTTVGCKVPNLILQPIIENAIRHGVASRSSPGWIEVRVAQEDHSLQLQVKDNGPGISKKTIRKGVGLTVTEDRLQRLYGKSQKLDLQNGPEGGLIVTMTIPVRN